MDKIFFASAYYVDEPDVFIEKGKTIRLYNKFYEIITEPLEVEEDDKGKYVSAAGKKYYLKNFIQIQYHED